MTTAISASPIGALSLDSFYRIFGGGIVWGGSVVGGKLMANSASNFWTKQSGTPFWEAAEDSEFWRDAYTAMLFQTEIFAPTKAAIGSEMKMAVDITGEVVRIEYRSAPHVPMFPGADNDPFWKANHEVFFDDAFYSDTPFQTWPGSIAAKNEQYQFQFFTSGGPIQGVIDTCRIMIDVPDIVERFSDLVISPSGTRLPLTKTYNVIQNVQVTLQADGSSTDGGAAVRAVVSGKDSSLGPMIRCYDALNVPVDGRVDVIVQGY